MTPCLKQTKEKKKKEREIHHLGNKWTVQASDILKGYLPLCLLENTRFYSLFDKPSETTVACVHSDHGLHT